MFVFEQSQHNLDSCMGTNIQYKQPGCFSLWPFGKSFKTETSYWDLSIFGLENEEKISKLMMTFTCRSPSSLFYASRNFDPLSALFPYSLPSSLSPELCSKTTLFNLARCVFGLQKALLVFSSCNI